MNRAREYDAKQNQTLRERQIPYYFTSMWNLRNKKKWGKEKEREPNQETDF